MDKHSACPARVYNDGGHGVGEWDEHRNISDKRQAGTHVFLMRYFETCAWRNQRKLPRGGGIGVEL